MYPDPFGSGLSPTFPRHLKQKMAALTHLPKMEIKKISLSKYFLSQSEYHLSCKSDTWIVKKVKVKKNYDLLSQKGYFSRSLHSDIWLKRNKKNFMSLKSEFWLTIPDHWMNRGFEIKTDYIGGVFGRRKMMGFG